MRRKEGRPEIPLETKIEISTRIRGEVIAEYGTVTSFYTQVGRAPTDVRRLARTVRGWLPPEERVQAGTVRSADFRAVRLPDREGLRRFCEWFEVTADWILFGLEPRYRTHIRDKASLADELAAYVAAGLRRHPDLPLGLGGSGDWVVDGSAILQDVINEQAARLVAWDRFTRKQPELPPRPREPNAIRLYNDYTHLDLPHGHPLQDAAPPAVAKLAQQRYGAQLAKEVKGVWARQSDGKRLPAQLQQLTKEWEKQSQSTNVTTKQKRTRPASGAKRHR